jgi:hypothetical protein
MDKIGPTNDYFDICPSCNKKCTSFYTGYEPNLKKYILRCQKCTFTGPMPGAGYYGPCRKCTPPVINWFHVETYGDIKKDCGNHEPPNSPLIDIFD